MTSVPQPSTERCHTREWREEAIGKKRAGRSRYRSAKAGWGIIKSDAEVCRCAAGQGAISSPMLRGWAYDAMREPSLTWSRIRSRGKKRRAKGEVSKRICERSRAVAGYSV